jgi:hypothetical protein
MGKAGTTQHKAARKPPLFIRLISITPMSPRPSLSALRQRLHAKAITTPAAQRLQGGCNDPLRCEPFIVDTDRPG